MKRTILAVIAGVIFIIVATTLVDIALQQVKIYPSGEPLTSALAVLATSYRIIIGIIGAWLTARLAPSKPMKHAMILGLVGMLLGLAGLVATWDKGLAPLWYPIALVVLAFPQCWAGGRLYEFLSASKTRQSAAGA